ncbi:MAG TPA: aminodeoxychorismate/anthranilate synthase component II [Methanolinea sp.]|jgi:anthranilate synthase/aminodeoxychorismate synthase-like glutamine amidotransferase|nr:MAG: Anthranilate synthase component 2 [Methanoregulaceae archaeon PtaB.Bin009]OPY42124.1 MAG: Anthranilate synthase component 2 [Methanoregulaceae archaeon PtaU1.Bin066]HII76689.1 aminodeoxychorismate/anthranilate synthase component II [Methanolinea sp.]HNQ29070.1 aminodeoxychorismate/anthranilate synthase component II [Methanolinea sp.]
MRVVIVDCFDSFTYNLYQMVGMLGAVPVPVTCDRTLSAVRKESPDRIILSPGPGTPEDSGVCPEVVSEFEGRVPILGVCLGHQTIIHCHGGAIRRMDAPVHGKTSRIVHDGQGLFAGLPNPFTATRYHSLAAPADRVPEEFETVALSEEDRCVMGVTHREYPLYGLQFHPESIMTPEGRVIMENFLFRGGA